MLHEMGIETGIDLPALLACARRVQEILGRPLGSHTLVRRPGRLARSARAGRPAGASWLPASAACASASASRGAVLPRAPPPRSTPAPRPPSRASCASAGRAEASSTRFARPTATGGWASSSSHERLLAPLELVGLDHAVDEPDALGLRARRSVRAVMISSLARPSPTTAGQPSRAADVGDDPEPDLRQARAARRWRRRAGRSRAPPRARRRRRCGGSGRRPAWPSLRTGSRIPGTHRGTGAASRAAPAEASQLAEVDAGGEHGPLAAQHDAVHAGVGRGLTQRVRRARAAAPGSSRCASRRLSTTCLTGSAVLGDGRCSWPCSLVCCSAQQPSPRRRVPPSRGRPRVLFVSSTKKGRGGWASPPGRTGHAAPAPVSSGADCAPAGVVSTMLPSAPLAVRMSPLGAMVRPSGSLSEPPVVTVMPPPPSVRGPVQRVGHRRDAVAVGVGDVQGAAGPQADARGSDDQRVGVGALGEAGRDHRLGGDLRNGVAADRGA